MYILLQIQLRSCIVIFYVRMYVLMSLQNSGPVKSQSSESDSEEEHDIDPSIYDIPVYTSTSSHGNKNDKDHLVDKECDNMFITASGHFIAPTSTLPRMR